MNDGSDSAIKWRSVILLFWNEIIRFPFFFLVDHYCTCFMSGFKVSFNLSLFFSSSLPTRSLFLSLCYWQMLLSFPSVPFPKYQRENRGGEKLRLMEGGRVYGSLWKINTMEKWCFWESGLIHRRAARGWFGSEWSFTVTTLNGCQNQCHNIHCVRLEMPECWRKRAEPNFRK